MVHALLVVALTLVAGCEPCHGTPSPVKYGADYPSDSTIEQFYTCGPVNRLVGVCYVSNANGGARCYDDQRLEVDPSVASGWTTNCGCEREPGRR